METVDLIKLPANEKITPGLLKAMLEAMAAELEWATQLKGPAWVTYRKKACPGKRMDTCYAEQILERVKVLRAAASHISPSNEEAKQEMRSDASN